MTSTVFDAPNLTPLIRRAYQGVNTAPATISTMTSSLQSQLTAGPLADLSAGTVTASGFVNEVQALIASYSANVGSQLSPAFPNVDQLLQLQGQRVVASVVALGQKFSVGLIDAGTFQAQAATSILGLTGGPVGSLGTPVSSYVTTTQAFSTALQQVADGLASGASPQLTNAQASATIQTESEAYRATYLVGLQVTHPNLANSLDQAVNTLVSSTTTAVLDASSDPQSTVLAAVSTFTSAVIGTNGIFGINGVVAPVLARYGYIPANLTVARAVTTIENVSGTADGTGTATLTARLTVSGTSAGIAGKTIVFTVNGTFAGTAVTGSDGVATLSGVPATGMTGTTSSGVYASFAGDISAQLSSGSGPFTGSKASTTLSNTSGTAAFGGNATLTSTLVSSLTNAPIPNVTVVFNLNGEFVGTATTNANGVATLTGVATTAAAGTSAGAVVATFAGDSTNSATSDTGDLVVSKANTTIAAASGTASFGGNATLVATLISSVTNNPVQGATISFTLNGTPVGTATTNVNGVATLPNVATTNGAGTYTGVVVATYAGDTNYNAAADVTGDLVVAKASTALTGVAGTASFGGTATLVATLTSSVTNGPVEGATVTFMLDGNPVGQATTNADGLATLSGVATSSNAGTYPGVVVASYAGDSDHNAAADVSGDLVVAKADTALTGVAANASFGGKATLVATLNSSVTSQPIEGATVTFTLDGNSVGNAVTDANGVATLSDVTTTSAAGTFDGVVVASYAGDSNYNAATDATGNLTVARANTALTAVSGTASEGIATLVATLTSDVTSQPIEGATVSFTLDGNSVGNAVTDANGVATLANVPTSDPAGTYPGVVVASYPGDSNYNAATDATGDLVVS